MAEEPASAFALHADLLPSVSNQRWEVCINDGLGGVSIMGGSPFGGSYMGDPSILGPYQVLLMFGTSQRVILWQSFFSWC